MLTTAKFRNETMNRTIRAKQFSTFILVLSILFLIPACSQEETRIVEIGTSGVRGNYHNAGMAISRVVNKEQAAQGVFLQPTRSSGSVANIDAILAGDIEFGIAQADRQYQAVNGLAEWESKGPQKALRTVFGLYTESVTLVAALDSGIHTVSDLKGKRIDVGIPGSGIRQNAIDVLDVAGIEWDKDINAQGGELDERVPMLMSGEIDAFFHTVGHPSQDLTFATFSVRGARFIPLINIDSILSKSPYYVKSVIPATYYPRAENKEDVETIGTKAIFVTSDKVPDDIVYAVTKAVFNNLESLSRFAPVLKTLDKENMLEGLMAPIHRGALKYYREVGIQIPSINLYGTADLSEKSPFWHSQLVEFHETIGPRIE